MARRALNRLALLTLAVVLLACRTGGADGTATTSEHAMNRSAEAYVKLVLAVGQHDADYVDSFYGPEEWKTEAERVRRALPEIRTEADALLSSLRATSPTGDDEMLRLRHRYLVRQLESLVARVDMLQGERLSFDDESKALYDAVAPTNSEEYFRNMVEELERQLPGTGPLIQRYDAFRRAFVIPPAKLDTVFLTAIAACRERTARHMSLPPGERFTVEYVTGKTWSGYNWYQGNYRSLIQVNTDLPIYIDRAVDLACHEGYPGHHIYNALLEHHLVRGRGWVETSVYPLFSPQSLIAEGSANYGIAMAFPGEERVRYEREVLFPLAGLDASLADDYYRVLALAERLSYAGNEAARRYLNGQIDAVAAADWLTRYALMSPDRARQRVRFMDQYRSYVINYNLGRDLVRRYVERTAGPDASEARRWEVFEQLLSSPRLPGDLQ
ncbi:MAG TPA: hypothetical protein VJ596_09720 [Gemmatimonadaceae bacterium]|nr:hypothetical protein [Gemmatimonadaceae bacterium]